MRIDVFSIFPDVVDDVLLGQPARQGPGGRPARPAHPRSSRPHHRRPPHGRRLPVRRRRRDADAARAGVRRRSRPPTRRGRCSCSGRVGGGSTRPSPTSSPAGDGFSLLCGRYEGVDHRVREHLVDDELSVGDVVLAGGEVAACLVIEAVTRLVPGVMGNDVSPLTESFGATGPARGTAVHAAGRVPRLGGSRRAAQWRPRPHRAVAARPGAAPHDRPPARPHRRAWRASPRRRSCCWKSSRRSRILDQPRPGVRPTAIQEMPP